MKFKGKYILLAMAISVSSNVFADNKADIATRIKPVGDVATATSAPKAAADTAAKPKGKSGEEIYNKYCTVCHQTGVAGAPIFGKADWKTRMDNTGGKDENAKLDDLVKVAKAGKNAMPAKGTCTDCSDDELKSAIQYMVSGGKKADAAK